MKIIPYCLPVALTSLFIICCYTGAIWAGPFIIPAVSLLHRVAGRFSPKALIAEYQYFHHQKPVEVFKVLNGIGFAAFNGWIVYFLAATPLSPLSFILFTYTAIVLNSNFSVSLAHDLMHSPVLVARGLATALLLLNGFFYLEADHIYIHHRFVGTPKDPASAKLGEPVYTYLARSIPQRAAIIFGAGHTFPPAKKKQIVGGNVLRLLTCLAVLTIAFFFNRQVFLWLLLQFVFVTLIYEVITYIQHYGLRRMENKGTTAGPVALHHSWNCDYKLSAYLHFMMPVHSIHHLKEEPELSRLNDAGPLYPKPFTHMVVSAFIPPYWFKLMNDRVQKLQQNDAGV